MSCWDILGIRPGADRQQLKKAYISRLKKTNPEDDPQGFQRLRQAYEEALSYVDAMVIRGESVVDVDDDSNIAAQAEPLVVRMEDLGTTDRSYPGAAERSDDSAVLNGLICRVLTVYRDDRARNRLESWKAILDSEALWNIDIRNRFRWMLFEILLYDNRLKNPILSLLEREFKWTENVRELYDYYDPDEVDRAIAIIESAIRHRAESTVAADQIPADNVMPSLTAWRGSESNGGGLWWLLVLIWLIGPVIERSKTTLPPNPDGSIPSYEQLLKQRRERAKQELRDAYKSYSLDRLRWKANSGVPVAQFELGQRYAEGRGVEADEEKALWWLMQAAANGHEDAIRQLSGLPARKTKTPTDANRQYK